MGWWNRPEARGLRRIVGSALVSLVFIVVLMTASAQQEVVQHLAANDPGLDYSTAYAVKLRVDREARAADDAARVAARAGDAASAAAARGQDALIAFNAAWDAFTQTVTAAGSACGLAPTAAATTDPAQRGQAIAALRTCRGNAALAADARTILNAGFARRPYVAPAYEGWAAASQRSTAAQQQLAAAQASAAALARISVKDQGIADSFDATGVIRDSWWLGGGALIDLPPALLQIVLSFVSGAFGALLLTLVLVVYPHSRFMVDSGQSGYGARILLGGLIALCVFVVVNGGSAVLGSNAVVTGSTNYMAFCAIAILAGMFSDRVAAWLSSRADAFFTAAGDDGEDAGTPSAAPSVPAAG